MGKGGLKRRSSEREEQTVRKRGRKTKRQMREETKRQQRYTVFFWLSGDVLGGEEEPVDIFRVQLFY